MAEDPLLEVEAVDFSYGRTPVLFDIDLCLPERGRGALLGTNGAGKSTLLRLVSGLARPRRGAIRYRGRDITRLDAAARVALGITQVSGGRALFPALTVEENLRLGSTGRGIDRATEDRRVAEVLDRFAALGPRRGQRAGSLSGGEAQMVAIGRALVAAPDLLIIDELSLGLAPVVVGQILAVVEELSASGVALLLVEQSINVAMAVADEAWFLEKGAVRFHGPTAELLDRGELVRSVFFGESVGSS